MASMAMAVDIASSSWHTTCKSGAARLRAAGQPSITTRRAGELKPPGAGDIAMDATDNSIQPPPPSAARPFLAGLLGPGVVALDAAGGVRFADERALELLGCADGFELERLWESLKARL